MIDTSGALSLSLNSGLQSGSCSRHTHHQALGVWDRTKVSSPIERVRSVIQRIDDDEPSACSIRGGPNHLKGSDKKAWAKFRCRASETLMQRQLRQEVAGECTLACVKFVRQAFWLDRRWQDREVRQDLRRAKFGPDVRS